MIHQRDELINAIYRKAKTNKSIYFLSADFGAPSLDKFREDLPNQFIHCGISEQHMIDLAVGLALDGNTVFCYAMAPFVSLRCLEQHKCGASIMDLPIITIVAGVGIGYADAGPTHYATEDLACLRSMINANVYTASDSKVAEEIVLDLLEKPKFAFIRLDRNPSENFMPLPTNEVIDMGFRAIGNVKSDLVVMTSGYMYGKVYEILEIQNVKNKFFLIDLIKCKPFPNIKELISSFKKLLIVDEQIPCGGLSSAVLEYICDNHLRIETHRITLPEKHFFENGGREHILSLAGLGKDNITKKVESLI